MGEGTSAWTIAGTAGVWAAVITLVTVLARQWVPLKKIRVEADEQLRDELAARVKVLEEKLEQKEAAYEAQTAILRHRLNNVTQCFDALLLLIEAAPEKAAEAVKKVKEMRQSQIVAEATEKAAIYRGRMDGANTP